MTTTRAHRGLVGLVAAALLVVLLALVTPVFAGSTGRRGGPTGEVALSIRPSTSRRPAAPPVSSVRQRPGTRRMSGAAGSVTLDIVPGRSGTPAPAPKHAAPVPRRRPTAAPISVTAARLRAIAAASPRPIYWAGPANVTYELTIAGGTTYVRYLPPGARVGTAKRYLTIGTYMRSAPPYQSMMRSARTAHATVTVLGDGAAMIQYRAQPHIAYLVFPKVRYEVSVYDPAPGGARRLVVSGKLALVR